MTTTPHSGEWPFSGARGDKCWWCGVRPADSREHKYKRSDLARDFGAGAWRGDNGVVIGTVGDDRVVPLQSSRADRLKFEKVICSDCNNSRSQPYDHAYATFSDWLSSNERIVLESGRYKWRKVFGPSWAEGRQKVIGYWLKIIGCHLAADGMIVPPKLIMYLNGECEIHDVPINLYLYIEQDVAEFFAISNPLDESIPIYRHEGHSLHPERGQCERITNSISWKWLTLRYTHDREQNASRNISVWPETVRLPRHRRLDKKTVQKFKQLN